MKKKAEHSFYLSPGHGHEKRKRHLRWLILAIIVGLVASSLFIAVYYLLEGPNPVLKIPAPPSVMENAVIPEHSFRQDSVPPMPACKGLKERRPYFEGDVGRACFGRNQRGSLSFFRPFFR